MNTNFDWKTYPQSFVVWPRKPAIYWHETWLGTALGQFGLQTRGKTHKLLGRIPLFGYWVNVDLHELFQRKMESTTRAIRALQQDLWDDMYGDSVE